MSLENSNNWLGLFLKKAQTYTAFTYLLMVGTGMLFYHQKYSEFGINIFQYADIFYFMVAPFEDSLILILCAILVLILAGSILFERVVSKKHPKLYTILHLGMNKKSWFPRYQAIFYPIAVIAVYLLYADVYGTRAKKEILSSEAVTIKFSDGESTTAKMIGKTQTVIFLLEGYEVKAIPLEAVKEIGIKTLSRQEATGKESSQLTKKP